MTSSRARDVVPPHTRLPIGLYAEVSSGSASVFGQIYGYDNDAYVIRIGGTDATRSAPATSVSLHPSYERIDSPLSNEQILTQILARRLPVGLHVEVNDGRSSYYGQISGYFECDYEVRVGGTTQTYQVPPECVSAHPTFRALSLERQRELFQHLPRLPKTSTIQSEERLTRMLSLQLEALISRGPIELGSARERISNPSLMGVGLFKIRPRDGNLSFWMREGNSDIFNGAMVNFYPTEDFGADVQINAKALCESLLRRAKILEYFGQISADLANYNVVAHLHYYRNREVPDPGFHKDTRGQTLFFILQYLNDKPIFGPEWVEDNGMAKLGQPQFVWVKSGDKQYLKSTSGNVFFEPDGSDGWNTVQLDSWELCPRLSPAEGEGVWPKSIRDALNFEKRRQNDPKIHVARVEPYGAVLVVDDLVHHRSPNQRSREQWGKMGTSEYPQTKTVQAFDARHENSFYEVDLTRQRARSLSDAREKLEQWKMWQRAQHEQEASEKAIVDDGLEHPVEDEDLLERWANTFSGERRRFFRFWVTVSPNPVRKEADKVWY